MNKYYVKSLGLAAWIMTNDIELLESEKTDKGYHLFWFENTPALHECMENYYKQDMLQKYTQAHMKLKKLIRSEPKQ